MLKYIIVICAPKVPDNTTTVVRVRALSLGTLGTLLQFSPSALLCLACTLVAVLLHRITTSRHQYSNKSSPVVGAPWIMYSYILAGGMHLGLEWPLVDLIGTLSPESSWVEGTSKRIVRASLQTRRCRRSRRYTSKYIEDEEHVSYRDIRARNLSLI